MASLNTTFLDNEGGFNSLRVIVGLVALITCGYFYTRSSKVQGGIPELSGPSLVSAWKFLQTRYDFLWSNFSNHDFFQFRVMQVGLITLDDSIILIIS